MYFSPNNAVEQTFQGILSWLLKVESMGILEWFLGIHFEWRLSTNGVDVYMNQAGFVSNLVKHFDIHTKASTPTVTSYRSGIPINFIPDATVDDDPPAQTRHREV